MLRMAQPLRPFSAQIAHEALAESSSPERSRGSAHLDGDPAPHRLAPLLLGEG